MDSSVLTVPVAENPSLLSRLMAVPGLNLPGPVTGIRRVLAACREQQYIQAARWFEYGPELWDLCPDYVKDYLDQCTAKGAALGFTVEADICQGDVAVLLVTMFADHHLNLPLETRPWHFRRRGSGWIIEKVG